IVTLQLGASLPLSCQVLDRNGYPIPIEATVSSAHGSVSGAQCGSLRVQRSGIDTLTFESGQTEVRVPVTIAVAPVANSPLGDAIVADTLPAQSNGPWAPSLHPTPSGGMDLYYAAYGSRDSS